MGSLSFGEIITILVIVLVIFGPERLPELARRLGSMVAKAREATASFTRQMETEYGEAAQPIRELRSQIEGAKQDISDVVSGIADLGVTDSGDVRPLRPGSPPEPAEPEADEGP